MTDLITRRNATLGPYSPLFYDEPLEFVSARGVWFTDVHGQKYLDGYNNVPHVGHCNDRVVTALCEQARTLNVHTRYLNSRVVDYSEALLATFEDRLERIFFGNSGSEANELALRITRQLTGAEGLIVSDFSYHGTTISLARMTTGLTTQEGLGPHVRTLRIPDLDTDDRPESAVLAATLAELDTAIDSLQEAGFGVAACLFDWLFSTEGMPRLPAGLVAGIAERIRAAGGLVIADEVQSGFGRTGEHMWGYQRVGLSPDLVTLGKPMGNGHPMSALITTAEVMDGFGPHNEFFNTFAGNPVSAAVGQAVLEEMEDKGLQEQARVLGRQALTRLEEFAAEFDFVRGAKGAGMFLGLDLAVDGAPAPAVAKQLVEAMKDRHVIISRIGRHDSVLKVRPPLAFGPEHLPVLLDALAESLAEVRID